MDLKNKLNKLKNSERINLNDEYLGEQGAKILAEFLKNNRYIKQLQLKGNDIGPSGIEYIFGALQNSQSIQSIDCEYNKIGIASQGVDAVAGFIITNKSIQHLGLANNSISGDDIDTLVNAIKASNLLSVDLKWNSLGTQGGQKLNRMLQHNKQLLYLEMTGNNVSEEVVDQIDTKMKINRKSNNIPKDKITGNQENQDNDDGLEDSQHQPERDNVNFRETQAQFQDSDGLGMIHHLENVLSQERLHTAQIKQRLEAELEELERKDRNDLRTIQDLETKIGDVSNQNKMMKFDIERLRDEYNIIEKSNVEQIRAYEDRIKQNQFLSEEMEKKHRMNCEKMLQENNYRIKELARDWESRCRGLEERIRATEIEKEQQEEELRRIEEKSVDVKIKQETELDELTRKVQEEEFQKYQANLVNIEARIQAVEEGHDLYLKRNGDLIQEYEKRDQEGNVEIEQYKQELERLEIEHEKFIQNNANFKSIAEKLKSELNIKEGAVAKLEGEINSLNQQIESKKSFGKNQLENTKQDHQKDRKQWEEEREQQVLEIENLEASLRQSHMENTRLRQEYLRLSEIVQSNINKEIFSTFSKNNFY